MEIDIYKEQRKNGTFLITYLVNDDLLKQSNLSPMELSIGTFLYMNEVLNAVTDAVYWGDDDHKSLEIPDSFGKLIDKCRKVIEGGVEVREYEIQSDGSRLLIDTYDSPAGSPLHR